MVRLPYRKDSTVYIATGDSKLTVLDEAIGSSGFVEHLNASFLLSGKIKEVYSIVIKTNIMGALTAADDSPSYTDPALVERLINTIAAQGFVNIVVADSENLFNYKFGGRTVPEVAQKVGYKKANYKIADLGKDLVEYDYESVLGIHTIAKIWQLADYRISFGKNKTDRKCFYAGCLKNLYGCLPQWDTIRYYETKKITSYEACILMADRFPVSFGFLDAWASGHKSAGNVSGLVQNLTKTIIASENILALDWVQGEKMDMDPAYNFVLKEAMLRWGTIDIIRKGNMTPWLLWKNISYLVVSFWGMIEHYPWLNKYFTKVFMSKPGIGFKK